MPLRYKVFPLGQLGNNTIVLFDEDTRDGFLIDPTFQCQPVLDFVTHENLRIDKIICTHGHFDHIAGVAFFIGLLNPTPAIAIDQKDLLLWQEGGGSRQFNFTIPLPPDPDEFLGHGQHLTLAGNDVEIREVPGHTPGSVALYVPSLQVVISGDTLFSGGVGRTDLPDGNYEQLIDAIRSQILSLPGNTVVIPGHGELTTIDQEKVTNPFLQ
jgi:glyoxylase-like metal-dependent hydrolase (beta-lactamase superfamily II)